MFLAIKRVREMNEDGCRKGFRYFFVGRVRRKRRGKGRGGEWEGRGERGGEWREGRGMGGKGRKGKGGEGNGRGMGGKWGGASLIGTYSLVNGK